MTRNQLLAIGAAIYALSVFMGLRAVGVV